MGAVRYGKHEVSPDQQHGLLRDLPDPMSRDCYFDEDDLVALILRAGANEVCPHCRQTTPTRGPLKPRQAKVLVQRLLRHWMQCCLVTYSTVLDKYRRLP